MTGNEEFVPELIRGVRETDGMAYIHTDVISALNGIDESGHERILSAITDGDIKDPFDVCALSEHFPDPGAFDHAVQLWIDDSDDSLGKL